MILLMAKCLFVSLNLPAEIKKKVKELVVRLVKLNLPVRWLAEENLHLTLFFLGYQDDPSVKKIEQSLKQTSGHHQPFQLEIKNLILIPAKNPKVVCLGFRDSDELISLQQEIFKKLFSFEKLKRNSHSFKPHITIGRLKRGIVDLSVLEKIKFRDQFEVKEIKLMESFLKPAGTTYQELANFSFES